MNRHLLLVCLTVFFSGFAATSAAPQPVIFDTDITGDVDDVLALALLHGLADRGWCEIRAVTISKEHELAARFVDAVNTFYGRPDIPLGLPDNAPYRESRFLKLVEEREGEDFRYPHDLGAGQQPEKAVGLLRKTLEAAEDRSVIVIQVGLATNLAQLLESEGGAELIARKVHHLSVMAGAFQTIDGNNHYLEANVRNHVTSMQTLAAKWPAETPVIWSGFAIGMSARYPRESIRDDFGYVKHHPVREAYLLHSGPDHDRPNWDLTSVLSSVFPDRGYFGLSPKGRVTVAEDGFTRFQPAPAGKDVPASQQRDRYLTLNAAQAARVREALVQHVVKPPRGFPGVEPVPSGKPRLIFDTDMGNDIDDAMALAMIHALQRRGACELLAVTSTKDEPKSAAFIDALNHFYGVPDVPIGAVRDGATPEASRFNGLADQYPHDLRGGEEAPEAVSLLRKTLAAQPDGSVTVVQVGFFTNLARLLDSGPDEASPLPGKELVQRKVKELVLMAGAFQTIRHDNAYREYNVIKDIPAAQKVAGEWPTPVVWSGFEIGIAAAYPWASIEEDFQYVRRHPIVEAYLAYVPSKPHDRPTWDLTAVLQAVYPDRGYFQLSPPGQARVAEDGVTVFSPSPEGRHRFLIMDPVQAERVREACVQLTSEPPKG
jgi:inosine-uridine nucleoside N-ribohydrolase